MKRTIRSIHNLGVPMLVVATISGCSTVKEGFVGEKHENVLPFAEQTVESLAVERINFRESEFTYLRAISEPGAPEVENLRKLLALADEFRDEAVYYSVDLVRVVDGQDQLALDPRQDPGGEAGRLLRDEEVAQGEGRHAEDPVVLPQLVEPAEQDLLVLLRLAGQQEDRHRGVR